MRLPRGESAAAAECDRSRAEQVGLPSTCESAPGEFSGRGEARAERARRLMGGMLEFPGVMLRRVAEVGFIEFIAERIEANLADPGAEWDPEFIRTLLPLMEIFNRYFDSEVRGTRGSSQATRTSVGDDPASDDGASQDVGTPLTFRRPNGGRPVPFQKSID